jgi:hypothetical protein
MGEGGEFKRHLGIEPGNERKEEVYSIFSDIYLLR